MTQWAPEAERSFKEVLYRFLEEVHCTKAALYLDNASGALTLAARYGFGRGDLPPEFLAMEDPLVVAAAKLGGVPLVVNSAVEAPFFEDRLIAAGTHRMLLTPLLQGDRMIGLVDARDKGGQQPFSDADARSAAAIGERLSRVARGFGLIVEKEPIAAVDPEELVDQLPQLAKPRHPPLLDLVSMVGLADAATRTLVRDGVYAVAVTVIHDGSATSLVFCGSEPGQAEESAIKAHQIEALLRVGGAMPGSADWPAQWRRVPGVDGDLMPALIASSVSLSAGAWSLVLSVVGAEGGPSPAAILDGLRAELVTCCTRCRPCDSIAAGWPGDCWNRARGGTPIWSLTRRRCRGCAP